MLLHPTVPPWRWGGPRTGCFPVVGSTAPCPGGVLGLFVPALWHSHVSVPLAGTVVVTSPAPVSAVPDWAIALLVLVSILLLLSILTCFLMVSPLSPCGSSRGVPCPRSPTISPDPFPPPDHLHLPPEKPREAGPQHQGFLQPHGRVPAVPEPRPLRAAHRQTQPLQPGETPVSRLLQGKGLWVQEKVILVQEKVLWVQDQVFLVAGQVPCPAG